MDIRNFEPSDIQEVADLMISVYNEAPWNNQWTEETAIESLRSIMESRGFYGNVILDAGKLVGAILGRKRTYSKAITYYIDEFFVSKEYRGDGTAENLYRFTRNELKNQGVGGAFFTTLRNSAAYRFYTKQGAWDLTDSACFYHQF